MTPPQKMYIKWHFQQFLMVSYLEITKYKLKNDTSLNDVWWLKTKLFHFKVDRRQVGHFEISGKDGKYTQLPKTSFVSASLTDPIMWSTDVSSATSSIMATSTRAAPSAFVTHSELASSSSFFFLFLSRVLFIRFSSLIKISRDKDQITHRLWGIRSEIKAHIMWKTVYDLMIRKKLSGKYRH